MAERTDINTASREVLESLPGVGPKLAAKIIAYRQTNGAFTSVSALREVKGIGAGLLERLAPHLTCNAPAAEGDTPKASDIEELDSQPDKNIGGAERCRTVPANPPLVPAGGDPVLPPAENPTHSVTTPIQAKGPPTSRPTSIPVKDSAGGLSGRLRALPVLPTALAGVGLLVICFGAFWQHSGDAQTPSTVPLPPQIMVLIDRSEHLQSTTGDACAALEQTLARYVEPTSAVARRDKRTQIEVFLTPATPQAVPERLVTLEAADFMVDHGVGCSQSSMKEALAHREGLRQDALSLCRQRASPVKGSSIHAAMVSLVTDLKERCDPGQHCELVTYSDLYDPSSPWLCAQVYGEGELNSGGLCPSNKPGQPVTARGAGQVADNTDEPSWSTETIPAVTPADGLTLTVCGIADSKISASWKAGPRVASRRAEVWGGLFPGSAFEVLNHCEFL